MNGELCREHWIVPVRGRRPAEPDGVVRVTACRDGTVVVHLCRGDTGVDVRLDVSRAAQLCTGIWEAAGAAQRLTGPSNHPPPRGRPADPPGDRRSLTFRSLPARNRSPLSRRRLPLPQGDAASEVTRMIGQRLRRVRKSRNKSLRVLAGLAGMSRSTLHRVEHGQRELTLSEIVALARALRIDPTELITLPNLTPTDT